MKKRTAIVIAMVVALIFLLSACNVERNELPSFDFSGAEPQYIETFPENEFTEEIIKPSSGELDYVLDLTESSRYAIFYKNIDLSESEKWLDDMLDFGFKKVQYAANSVSVGTILQKDDVYLSVAFSDGSLAILIAIKK